MSTWNRPVVGVIGGGQLARMMAQPAVALGVELSVLIEDPAHGAGPVIRRLVAGDPDDEQAIRRLWADARVVTVDHEVLDLALMRRLEDEGMVLRPGSGTLSMTADKLAQKHRLVERGLPVVDFVEVDDRRRLDEAFERFDDDLVLKRARGGYDGRGVWIRPALDEATDVVDRVLADRSPLIAERTVSTDLELAVLVVRRPGGEAVVYDPVATVQRDGMCREVRAPAPVSAETRSKAMDLARQVAEAFGSVGVLAVEMFHHQGALLVNEVAPRPHNSGHHTIDAAVTSQFENHLRAVLDLPLGDPSLTSGAVTVNVVGRDHDTDPRRRLAECLAVDPAAHVHLYDKDPRPERKVGHVTVCHDDPDAAANRAWKVVETLGGAVVR